MKDRLNTLFETANNLVASENIEDAKKVMDQIFPLLNQVYSLRPRPAWSIQIGGKIENLCCAMNYYAKG